MTIWERSSKAFIYYGILAVLWTTVFVVFFSVRDFFRALDVLCSPILLFSELPKSIACVVTVRFFIKSIDNFAGVLYEMYQVKKQDEKFKEIGSSGGVDGVQGIGKTRLLIYIGMILQKERWEDLRFDYYINCPIEDKLKQEYDDGLQWRYIRFLSQKESVEEYFNAKDKMPLIYSNIDITYNGQTPRDLKREHFTQDERLYENNIKIASELDNILPNTLRKVKDASEDELKANLIDEFAGLDRQYTGGLLLADTHRNGALYLSIRDCQQVKYHLIERKMLYTPGIFLKLYKKIYNRVINKTKTNTSLRTHKLAKWLQAQIRSIGFTKIYYVIEKGSDGLKLMNKNEMLCFYLPNQVPYAYDDRALQKDYLPLGYRKRPKLKSEEDKTEPKKKKRKGDKKSASDTENV